MSPRLFSLVARRAGASSRNPKQRVGAQRHLFANRRFTITSVKKLASFGAPLPSRFHPFRLGLYGQPLWLPSSRQPIVCGGRPQRPPVRILAESFKLQQSIESLLISIMTRWKLPAYVSRPALRALIDRERIVPSRSLRPMSTNSRIVKERDEGAKPQRESIHHVWDKFPYMQNFVENNARRNPHPTSCLVFVAVCMK